MGTAKKYPHKLHGDFSMKLINVGRHIFISVYTYFSNALFFNLSVNNVKYLQYGNCLNSLSRGPELVN